MFSVLWAEQFLKRGQKTTGIEVAINLFALGNSTARKDI
jgi:hypothetical protein